MRRRFTKDDIFKCIQLVDRCWGNKPLSVDLFIPDGIIEDLKDYVIVHNGRVYCSLLLPIYASLERNLNSVAVNTEYRIPFISDWANLLSTPYTISSGQIKFQGGLNIDLGGVLLLQDDGTYTVEGEGYGAYLMSGTVQIIDFNNVVILISTIMVDPETGEVSIVEETLPVEESFYSVFIPIFGVLEDGEIDPDSGEFSDGEFKISPTSITFNATGDSRGVRLALPPGTEVASTQISDSWIGVRSTSTTQYYVSALDNRVTTSRNGSITWTLSDGQSATLAITQAANSTVNSPRNYIFTYKEIQLSSGNKADILDIASQNGIVAFTTTRNLIVSRDQMNTFEEIVTPFGTSPTSRVRVFAANDTFVFFSGNKISSTTDFINWQDPTTLSETSNILNVTYNAYNNIWACIGDGGANLWTSTNLTQWTKIPTPTLSPIITMFRGIATAAAAPSLLYLLAYSSSDSTARVITYNSSSGVYNERSTTSNFATNVDVANVTNYWFECDNNSNTYLSRYRQSSNVSDVFKNVYTSLANYDTFSDNVVDGACPRQGKRMFIIRNGGGSYTGYDTSTSDWEITTLGTAYQNNCIWYAEDMDIFIIGHNENGFSIATPRSY